MQGPPKAGLSQADAAQLEERALKMRKAMGENIADDVAGETPDARTRRLNLIRCVPPQELLLNCHAGHVACLLEAGSRACMVWPTAVAPHIRHVTGSTLAGIGRLQCPQYSNVHAHDLAMSVHMTCVASTAVHAEEPLHEV